jgi:hypothetical protein
VAGTSHRPDIRMPVEPPPNRGRPSYSRCRAGSRRAHLSSRTRRQAPSILPDNPRNLLTALVVPVTLPREAAERPQGRPTWEHLPGLALFWINLSAGLSRHSPSFVSNRFPESSATASPAHHLRERYPLARALHPAVWPADRSWNRSRPVLDPWCAGNCHWGSAAVSDLPHICSTSSPGWPATAPSIPFAARRTSLPSSACPDPGLPVNRSKRLINFTHLLLCLLSPRACIRHQPPWSSCAQIGRSTRR